VPAVIGLRIADNYHGHRFVGSITIAIARPRRRAMW